LKMRFNRKRTAALLTLALVAILSQIPTVIGHGRLMEPPARGTAWRYGFNTPKDYTDNEENCGGFAAQWNEENNGKCGVCGDRWDGVRENETPGKYATGTIVANYKSGQDINVKIRITSNHKGWVEFRLCENNDINKDKDQKCFDEHLLLFKATGKTRQPLGEGNKNFTYKVSLPQGVACSQCILQWHYNAGNSWGVDPVTKEGCIGCGPQETFWGCSDIAISSDNGGGGSGGEVGGNPVSGTTTTIASEPTQSTTSTTITTKTTTNSKPAGSACKAVGPWKGQLSIDNWCKEHCAIGYCPASHCTCKNGADPTTEKPPSPICKAAGPWKGQLSIDNWCKDHCAIGYCPASHCSCS